VLGLLRLRDSVVGVNMGKERMLSNLSRYENHKNRRFFGAKCHFVVYNRDMSGAQSGVFGADGKLRKRTKLAKEQK
jgi:hypothetical protein